METVIATKDGWVELGDIELTQSRPLLDSRSFGIIRIETIEGRLLDEQLGGVDVDDLWDDVIHACADLASNGSGTVPAGEWDVTVRPQRVGYDVTIAVRNENITKVGRCRAPDLFDAVYIEASRFWKAWHRHPHDTSALETVRLHTTHLGRLGGGASHA